MKEKIAAIKEKIFTALKFLKNSPKLLKEKWPEIKAYVSSTEGIIVSSIVVVVLFIITVTIESCTPRKGPPTFGICRSFLELQIPFPHTIKHRYMEQYPKGVRIYYSHIDSFGEYQLESVECTFAYDKERGTILERVYFDHIKDITQKYREVNKGKKYRVKQEYIDLFNKSRSLAAISAQEPDLTLPDPDRNFSF